MNARQVSFSEFMKAAEEGDLATLQLYIENNNNNLSALNAKNSGGFNALLQAVCSDQSKVVELLLNTPGVDVDGQTVLMFAINTMSSVKIVGMLLSNNDIRANLNHADKYGYTALSYAASIGSKKIIEMLLEWGADVNHASLLGYTPLMLAAMEKHYDATVQLLETVGINAMAKNNEQMTAEDLARNKKHIHLANLIAAMTQITLANQQQVAATSITSLSLFADTQVAPQQVVRNIVCGNAM